MNINLQQLAFVVETAKHGSINKAAKSLYTSQPNISIAIANLEEELNAVLFIRNKNGVVLTDEGKEFIKYAKKVLNDFDELKSVYKEKIYDTPIIRISCNKLTYVNKTLLLLYNKFLSRTDRFSIYMRETHPQYIYKDVIEGTSNIGIVSLYKNNINNWMRVFKDNDIEYKLLFWSEECVLLRKDHPFILKKKKTFDDLKKYPLIQALAMNTGSPNVNDEIEYLRYKEFPRIIHTVDRSTLYNFLQYTDAIFFAVTDMAVDSVYPAVTSLSLSEFLPDATWGHFLLTLKNRRWSKEEQLFVEQLYDVVGGAPK